MADDPDVPSLALCRELAAMGWSQVGEQLYYLPPDYEHASLCNHDAPCDRVAAPTLGEMMNYAARRGWRYVLEYAPSALSVLPHRVKLWYSRGHKSSWGCARAPSNAFAEALAEALRETKEVDRG